MHESKTKYYSYLLRLWQDGPHALWHASVQCVQSREIVHFADVDDLVAFLWTQATPHPHPQEDHTSPTAEE